MIPRELLSYGIVLAIGTGLSVLYNEVRWGQPNDIGYALFCSQDLSCAGGLFSPRYLSYELYSYLVRGPDLIVDSLHRAVFPYFRLSEDGLALTFASPGLILAAWAPHIRTRQIFLTTALLIATPSLIYFVNGWRQIGMRHALDFEPFLFVLMALALRASHRPWAYPVMALSIAVGIWQVWFWLATHTR